MSNAWRTPAGDYLVQGPTHTLHFGAEALGVDPAEFHFVCGDQVKRFSEPLPFSIEDEQGTANIHVCEGSELVCYCWSQRGPYNPEVKREVCVSGLQPVANVPGAVMSHIRASEKERLAYVARLRDQRNA